MSLARCTFLRYLIQHCILFTWLILRVWVSQKWFSQQSVIQFKVCVYNTTHQSHISSGAQETFTFYISQEAPVLIVVVIGGDSYLWLAWSEFKALETLCYYLDFENDPIVLFFFLSFFESGTQGLNITWNLVGEWLQSEEINYRCGCRKLLMWIEFFVQ